MLGDMIKIVVTGSGYWGKNLVRNFHALGALAGICDKDPRILQNLQEMYDGVATFQRFDDVLVVQDLQLTLSPLPRLRKKIYRI